MKNVARFVFASALFLCSTQFALANISYNPSAPTTPQAQFGFYCAPYTQPFTSGDFYITAQSSCTYELPALNGSNIFLAVYKGTPGNSALVGFDFGPKPAQTILDTSPNDWSGQQGDDFFSVAVGYDDFNDILAQNTSFQSGGSAPLPYEIVQWKWGLPAAPLTIVAEDKTITYGSPIPMLTYLIDGFVNGDTYETSDVTGSASCETTATSASAPGFYPINCTQGTLVSGGNYVFPFFLSGTLTVNKAPLTVTADAKDMVEGSAVPVLTASITGFVNGEVFTTSDVTGSASCTTTATSASPAGTYPITCTVGTLDSTNYAFDTFQAGVLTVTTAPPVLDTTAPIITITSPLKYGLYTKSDSIFVTATIDDQSPLATTTYWLGNKKINPSLPLPLSTVTAPSIQSVSVAAKDIYGNAATSTVKFFVVRNTNSCLLDIIQILTLILKDKTLPDKPTLQNLIADCSALLKGHHRWDH